MKVSGLRHSRLRLWVLSGSLVCLTVVGLQLPPGHAEAFRREAPTVQKTESVPGKDYVAPAVDVEDEAAANSKPAKEPRWPAAAAERVAVAKGKRAQAGQTPIWVTGRDGSPADVAVELLGRKETARTGVRGLVVKLAAGEQDGGRVGLAVGYAGLEGAFGGDWISRLRFVEMPACFTETPEEKDCQQGTPIRTRIDHKTKTAVADVQATSSGTTLALAAGASGTSGSYAATPLSPSATWNLNLQTGDFSWSYPLRVPPSINGPRPALQVNYSSGSVDGRTAGTNNQTSWLGEGQSLEWGYIERRYQPCLDDMDGAGNNGTKTGDLCWVSNNASIVFAGRSGELVRDETTHDWHLKNDDGSRLEKLTGAANGDNDGEHWRLTTTDGTQYYFGLVKRYAADTVDTKSTSTVPVFGNNAGEPCYTTSYATAHCKQAWRWNLDYVVDVNGNTMTYFYANETNYYGRNLNKGVSNYERATYLTRIEYGERKGSEATTTAPARVLFTTAERCIPTSTFDCAASKLTEANAHHWPDVPFDQICTSSTTCPDRFSPAFFTRKRLTGITTEVWNGTAYAAVDGWTFEQSFPQSGDGTSASLWLKSIAHTGKVGTAVTLPKIGFVGTQLENRVDGLDTAPPMIKYRVSSITSETGGLLSVQYTDQDCSPNDLPASKAHNTRRCYPVYYSPDGADEPSVHFFHKYLVSSVIEADRMGGAEDVISTYQYKGGAAWHYDDDELTKPKYKTYGQFRGYEKVAVIKGDTLSKRTYEEHTFLRGMDGDRLPDGTKRDVTVTDSRGGTIADLDRYNGVEREVRVFNGVGGAEVSSTISTPWVSEPLAVEGADKATVLQIGSTRTRIALESGGERTTGTNTTYDKYGMPVEEEDLGAVGTAADDLCTRTTYNRSVSKWILTPVRRVETVSASCSATPSRPADVVSDVRMYYDGAADLAAEPIRGRLTKTESLHDWDANGAVYRTKKRSAYDVHGREIESYDSLNRLTKTEFTPATGALPTSVKTTNAVGHVLTTSLNREWGLTTAEVNASNRRTDLTYDGLGRLTQVWLPGRSKSAGATPNMKFTYSMTATAAPYVKTEELLNDGTYKAAYAIFDSLLRPRQTQAPAAGSAGGRILTDTRYDSRGLAVDQLGPYYNSAAPGATIFSVTDVQIPSLTRTTYDGAARPTVEAFLSEGVEKWRTTTSYGGDRVHVDPRAGDIPTTVISDARGRTSELRRYTGPSPTGAFEAVSYAYDPAGNLTQVTDPGGSVWKYEYDIAGRRITAVDPDNGTTRTTYDVADQVVTTTDAEGRVLWHKYDGIGRKLETRNGGPTGALRTSWTFDTLAAGKATSSSRWINGNEYKVAVTGYDAAERPTGSQVTIPASEGALAGTYSSYLTYNVDGGVKTKSLPAAPGLQAETLRFFYNAMGQPEWFSGIGSYVTGTTYSPYGEPLQVALGQTVGKFAWQTYRYETGTRRMIGSQVDRENSQDRVSDTEYTFDPAGNITSIADRPTGQAADVQCFQHDWAKRLVEAWTVASGTCGTPSTDVMGTGATAYWHSWTYDADGNRKTETQHAAAGNVLRTYGYTSTKPHALTDVTTTAGTGTTLDSYAYDKSGNLTQRQLGGADAETFAWDAEGKLASHTEGAASATTFVYDADGARLLRKEPGATTLYVDNTEIRLEGAALTSTRYYVHNGQNVALRTAAGVRLLADDHQGTTTVQLDAATLAVDKERTLPFGGARGPQAAMVGEKGFVGGTEDASTGLTHLGAREYDPTTGRFISVDPVIDLTDPTQMTGYAYANHSPVTSSDPSGLMLLADGGGGGYNYSYGKYGVTGGSRGSGHDIAPPYVPTVIQEAETAVNEASADYEEAKEQVIEAAKEIGEIILDELGISAGLDCLTTGDVGSCAETALNVLGSMAGGMIAKLAAKYGFPWKWDDGARLVGKVTGLVDDAIDGIDNALDARKTLDNANDALATARKNCNSFVPGTPVLLADGRTVGIEDVEVGDQVLATDPVTGESGARTVRATIIGQGTKELVHVRVDTDGPSGDGHADVVATDEHPFWVESRGAWVLAEDVRPGDRLRTADGDLVEVLDTWTDTRYQRVHNLTVDDLHTYFVTAGGVTLLVHNDGGVGPVDKGKEGTRMLIADLEAQGYTIRGTEISVRGKGVNVRLDVVAEKDGQLSFFDAKNGPNAGFTKNQAHPGGYAEIEAKGGEFYGKNAKKAGLSGKFGPMRVNIAGFGGYCG